jgi:hypothetical protein
MKKRQAQKCKGAHQKTSDGKRGNTKNAKGSSKIPPMKRRHLQSAKFSNENTCLPKLASTT